MNYVTAREKLNSIHQQHLLDHWPNLTEKQQQHLLNQIQTLSIEAFHAQQDMRHHKPAKLACEPFKGYHRSENDVQAGNELISKGEVGCLIVAGGQGTRLRFDGPKGKYPVSVIKKKTLFQLFAEKTAAAGKLAGRNLSIAIMTSPSNHNETVDYFQSHHYFGLKPEQVTFYQQAVLPLLDNQGNLFLENPWTISEGPDGNGSALSQFVKTGVWERWYEQGIQYVNFIQIDNPLAEPFDPELVGYHAREKADVTVKCTERRSPSENVGMLVSVNGKAQVIEYTELDPNDRANQDHCCANLSLFCLSMSFIKSLEKFQMPLHLAHKAVKFLDKHGLTEHATEPNAWKYEKFIFDILPAARKVAALLYPREICFAPLKNLSGHDSIVTVQEALQQRDRAIFAAITGKAPPNKHFELAQDFYYPTPDLLKKWAGKDLPENDYIEP